MISFDEFKARQIEDNREQRKIAKKIADGKKIAQNVPGIKPIKEPELITVKLCANCKQPKPLIDFNKDNSRPDKLATICRLCDVERNKKYRTKQTKGRKTCACCGKVKSVANFIKCLSTKDGLAELCKSCKHDKYKKAKEQKKLMKLTPKDKLEIEICEGGCILTIKERGNTGPLNVKKRSIASNIENLCEILSKYEI